MSRRTTLAFALLAAITIVHALGKRHGSLERNRIFAGRVITGTDPYATPVHAPYPPSYGIVMSPLLVPPIGIARAAWALLQVTLLFALASLCTRWWRVAHSGRDPPWWLAALAFVLVFRYYWRDTAGGGGNLVWGTLVALACVRPEEAAGQDRKPWLGIGLGLVLAAKPTPILFLPWLWLRGRHKTLAVALVTAAALHLAPIVTLGLDGWTAAYGRWIEGSWAFANQADAFAEPAYDFPKFTWMHQSLRYCIARFLTEVPSQHALDSALFFPGLGLSAWTAHQVQRMLSLLLVAITMFALWRSRRETPANAELAAFATLSSLTLLLSPITWKAHHVQLFPAFFLLLSRPTRSTRIGLVAYMIVCVMMSQLLLGKGGKNLMQSFYVVTIGALWVWAVSLSHLRSASSKRSAPGSTAISGGSSS